MEFFIENWVALTLAAMAFIKVVVNLTPTETDNMVFGYVDLLITAITGDRRKKSLFKKDRPIKDLEE